MSNNNFNAIINHVENSLDGYINTYITILCVPLKEPIYFYLKGK